MAQCNSSENCFRHTVVQFFKLFQTRFMTPEQVQNNNEFLGKFVFFLLNQRKHKPNNLLNYFPDSFTRPVCFL